MQNTRARKERARRSELEHQMRLCIRVRRGGRSVIAKHCLSQHDTTNMVKIAAFAQDVAFS